MILQNDTTIHYTNMEPEGLRLLYPHITLIFNGVEPKVEVKGKFEGPLGIVEVKKYKILDMPKFMVWMHQITLISDISTVVYKIPTFFSEVLITPKRGDEDQVSTGPLVTEFAL